MPINKQSAKTFYVDSNIESVNKKQNPVCGDYTLIKRYIDHTDFILCDGMGSGPKANMFAILCASRILKLLEQGVGLMQAVEKAVEEMHKARTQKVPFAAFSLIRILKNGQYTILSYEIPEPILVYNGYAEVLIPKHSTCGNEIIAECSGTLPENAYILLTSDGVSQAGLGIIKTFGWGTEGFSQFLNKYLSRNYELPEILKMTLEHTYALSNNQHQDDTTIACLSTRRAKTLNVLSGPPSAKNMDREYVENFMDQDGQKLVCGSTTLEIVGRELKEEIKIENAGTGFNEPPYYSINGIDIASEGAVTLNQVYNLLDIDIELLTGHTVVFEIAAAMLNSDIIKFFIGTARNDAHEDITFKQLGVMERSKVINHIVNKLKKLGKVVDVIYF